MAEETENEIVFSVVGPVALIRLNRPRALNALTRDMCVQMKSQLDAWAADEAIKTVLIEGEGEKGFCAGGDVVAIYEAGKEGRDDWQRFFYDEYRNNRTIARFPKPYIALMDGVTMGGGVGVSIHGQYRIATERTVFAMPETGLGLIPDVGGSYFLPRLPGQTGMFLALTGYRAKAHDLIYLGAATHFIDSSHLDSLKDHLSSASNLNDAAVKRSLDELSSDPGEAPLAAYREQIDHHFSKDSVEAIIESLRTDDSDWAADRADELLTKSPTSMKVSFAAGRRGADLDIEECLRMEYRIVNRIMTHDHDFYEGVRALLIDKDREPKWRPPTLQDVSDDSVEVHFTQLGENELIFD